MRSEREVGNAGNRPTGNLPSEVAATSRKRKIDPAVKAWLDNVIIPAMVLEYLAEAESRENNGLIPITERVQ
jgi:hypothetical protein